MNRLQRARARSRGYGALSSFFAYGVTSRLAPFLQEAGASDAASAHFDAEAAAAAHYHVLGRTLFAAQSVFLSSDGRRGGDEVERVRASYTRCGFMPPTNMEHDGIACQLAALAHLCGAEADALEDRIGPAAATARALQGQFLGDHLLRWLPALGEALQQQPNPQYARSGALLLGVVDDHLSTLGAQTPAPAPVAPLPAPDPHADDTSLRAIAGWLLAPACAGYLVTRDALHTIAMTAQLPFGFADRRTLLMDLLRAAGAYGALPALLNALAARTAQSAAAYRAMALTHSCLAPWVTPWIDRVTQTAHVLSAMRAAQ